MTAPADYRNLPDDVLTVLARTPSSEWVRQYERPEVNPIDFDFDLDSCTLAPAPQFVFRLCAADEAVADPHGAVTAKLVVQSQRDGKRYEFICMQYLAGNTEPWTRIWEQIAAEQTGAVDELQRRTNG